MIIRLNGVFVDAEKVKDDLNTYEVAVRETGYAYLCVKAGSEEEARKIAQERIDDGDYVCASYEDAEIIRIEELGGW